MTFNDKILYLRKKNGMSQENMAEKLGVSRQAISRWEQGTAMPDACNILGISRITGVSTDWLLDESCGPENEVTPAASHKENDLNSIMVYLLTLEAMSVMIQFVCVFILQNVFFAFLSFVPFIAMIGGFEYAYIKHGKNTAAGKFRIKFYKISAWLGLYFPVRFGISVLFTLWPRPYTIFFREFITHIIYITAVTLVNLSVDRQYIDK